MQLDQDFAFKPLPALGAITHFPFTEINHPLGPLQDLPGTWKGTGFNTIWRPHFQQQDRFLELNLTEETIEFEAISGPIPNRGLLQADINMFGLTYLQQIKDATTGSGLHIEPGIWATAPATTNPKEPASVVRMASIPHGTTIVAQGTALTVPKPLFQEANIIPFPIGGATPPNSDFATAEKTFTELNLAIPTNFRLPSGSLAGLTQAMVVNPVSVLQAAVAGQTITQTVVLQISSSSAVVIGGGTANTAFLKGGPAGPNAVAQEVDAIFWIETVQGEHGQPAFLQLQYTQRVLLNFNGLSWPHISVATLKKQAPVHTPVKYIDPEMPDDLLAKTKA